MKQYNKAQKIFEELATKYPQYSDFRIQLADILMNMEKDVQFMELTDKMLLEPADKLIGHFLKGIYYSRKDRMDSAIYFYNESKKYYNGYCSICDNNIGHIYFVNNNTDSARKYFRQVLAKDSTYPFAHFNLGVIEEKEGDPSAAIKSFYSTIVNATGSTEGFITKLNLYLGKSYDTSNRKSFEEFSKRTYIFNMAYFSYLSILYAYIRVPGLIDSTSAVDYVFEQLFTYKQYEATTWFHHACYKAMKKDKTGAVESLDKALKLGFGSYYQLIGDKDLDFIRQSPEFNVLLEKYFPEETKKTK